MKELLISTEKIIDCLNDGVYVCDRDRRIVFWSKSAERITGWRSEDVLGRACYGRYPLQRENGEIGTR